MRCQITARRIFFFSIGGSNNHGAGRHCAGGGPDLVSDVWVALFVIRGLNFSTLGEIQYSWRSCQKREDMLVLCCTPYYYCLLW